MLLLLVGLLSQMIQDQWIYVCTGDCAGGCHSRLDITIFHCIRSFIVCIFNSFIYLTKISVIILLSESSTDTIKGKIYFSFDIDLMHQEDSF